MRYKYRTGKALIAFLLVLLLSSLHETAWADGGGLPAFPGMNPDYLSYLENAKNGTLPNRLDRKQLGGIPFATVRPDMRHAVLEGAEARTADAPLPTSYDVSALGLVGPVRDQGRWGACWAFAATAAMESYLLKNTGRHLPLSTLHHAYYGYVDESAELPAYESSVQPDSISRNYVFDNGGNHWISAAIFSRGTGPVSAADAPYPSSEELKTPGEWIAHLPGTAPTGATVKRLAGVRQFFEHDDIKHALTMYGALSVNILWLKEYEKGKNYYLNVPTDSINHLVSLVGWDDTYSRENFRSGDRVPPRDGAWRIQNSWGTTVGDGGYWWVSYDDTSLFNNGGAAAFLADEADTYDRAYFHDPLGMVTSLEQSFDSVSGDRRVGMSTAFIAKGYEEIVSVGFFTDNANLDYEVQIYKDIPYGRAPSTGTPYFAQPMRGFAGPIGFYRETLDTPVAISPGERFAVEVTLIMRETTAPNDRLLLPAEQNLGSLFSKSRTLPGNNYLTIGGETTDTFDHKVPLIVGEDKVERNYNLCVKAYTKIRASSGGGSGGCAASALSLFPAAILFAVLRRKCARR